MTRTLRDGDPPPGDAPDLREAEIGARLAARQGDQPPARQRYELRGVIGEGATSRIYTIYDRSLERLVALKMLQQGATATAERAGRFTREAAVTAGLDHPNVPPVYDVDIAADGAVFYTMKQVEGRSLGTAIAAWAQGTEAPPPLAERVAIIIRVANAVEAAHARDLVHRDIKPDNIMLGNFGEVFLVDWGTVQSPSEQGRSGQRVGTPLYMSPEAARSESATSGDDLYSLAATLFATLTLRPPTAPDELERFWARKAAGGIDLPTAQERESVPPHLLAIALKGIAPALADRYGDATALRRDLEAWIAGETVSAWRETPWERMRRWHRRHGRTLWRWTAAALVVAALLGVIWGERLKEMATWGAPVLHETFADDSWQSRWVVTAGAVERRDGALVTTGADATRLDLLQRLDGAIAIEYTGAIPEGTPPGDISLLLGTRQEYVDAKTADHTPRYQVQIGAYDASCSAIIYTDGRRFENLAYSDFRPRSGQRYRVRIEAADRDLTVRIDGRVILHHVDPLPFTGGFVTLYGYYPGKSFSDIRVYSRGMPQRLSATAVGDAFAQAGDAANAREQYARVARVHADTALGNEARFKLGTLAEAAGDHAAADRAWAGLDAAPWRDFARLARLERAVTAGDDDVRALAEAEDLYRNGSGELRQRLTLAWNRWVVAMRDRSPVARTDAWLALRERVFPQALVTEYNAAETLITLDRPQEVLDRFPRQQLLGCSALWRLQRGDEIPERFPEQRWQAGASLVATGRSAEIAARYPEQRMFIIRGLIRRGHPEEADALAGPQGSGEARLAMGRLAELVDGPDATIGFYALLFSGRAAEALARSGTDDETRASALIALERYDEAMALMAARRHSSMHAWPAGAKALMACIAGDPGPGTALLAQPRPLNDCEETSLSLGIILPMALALRGHDGQWTSSLARLHARRWDLDQHPWHRAAYLLGEIDDQAFLAQPHGLFAASDLALLRAIRDERAGRAAEAITGYRAWLTIPQWKRGYRPDPSIDAFVRWRIAALGG